MPKERESINARVKRFVLEFGAENFKVDGNTLFCIPCEKAISSERKSQVVQHVSSQSFIKM